jgi:hemerythrin-like domain-containing protein
MDQPDAPKAGEVCAWADTPFALLPIPGTPGGPTTTNVELLSICVEMANVHNVLLRGLNAIYLQCPYVMEEVDVADFMLYVKAWGDTVHHHHEGEEKIFFPYADELARGAGLCEVEGKSLMQGNVEQHRAFEVGLEEMTKYVESVRQGSEVYKWKELKMLIDRFAGVLTSHLHDEIGSLMKLEMCDGKMLKKKFGMISKEGAKTADPVSTVYVKV